MEEKKEQQVEQPQQPVKAEPKKPSLPEHTWLSFFAYVSAFVGSIGALASPIVWFMTFPGPHVYDTERVASNHALAAAAFDGSIMLLAIGLICKCLNDIRKAVEFNAWGK